MSRGAKLNRGGDWGFKTVFRKSVFLDWVWSRLVLIPGVDDVLFDAGLRYGPLGMFLKEQPELEKASWEATLIKMEEIRQILTGAEVEQIVMIIPTAQQVRYRDKRPANQDYRLPNRILAESLTEHGVDFLDMLNLIEVQPAEVGDAMYYVRDIHWTPEGHRFAAEILAERIWDAATKESGGVEGAVKPSVEPPPPTR